MKYVLAILTLVFIASTAWALCSHFDRSSCPTKNCPQGTFMGDNGYCYPCDTEEYVFVNCLGYKKVYQLCPDRFTEFKDCNEVSGLTCFGWSKEEMKKHIEERTPKQYSNFAQYLNPFLKLEMLYAKLPRDPILTEMMALLDGVDYTNHTCWDDSVDY